MDLKAVRISGNMTQKELANACGVSQQCYSYIETGKRKPSPRLARKIGRTLGFDWTLFFEGDDEPQKAR